MLMTPGLGLFYGGMVRRKNVLSGIGNREHTVGAVWIYAGFGRDVNGIIGFDPLS